MQILGMDHAMLSGLLIERWRFPDNLILPSRFHHDPTGNIYGVHADKGQIEQTLLDLYGNAGNDEDMVLLDMVMPKMVAGETYGRMKEINPEIKVLLSSGLSKIHAGLGGLTRGKR